MRLRRNASICGPALCGTLNVFTKGMPSVGVAARTASILRKDSIVLRVTSAAVAAQSPPSANCGRLHQVRPFRKLSTVCVGTT